MSGLWMSGEPLKLSFQRRTDSLSWVVASPFKLLPSIPDFASVVKRGLLNETVSCSFCKHAHMKVNSCLQDISLTFLSSFLGLLTKTERAPLRPIWGVIWTLVLLDSYILNMVAKLKTSPLSEQTDKSWRLLMLDRFYCYNWVLWTKRCAFV